MRAVTCIRVSSPAQAKAGFGLDEQAAQVRHHCSQRGHTIVEALVDDGISGTLRDRPAIRRIGELIAAGAVSVVVFPHIDRLARTAWIGQDLLHEWESQGAAVEFAAHPSPDTPAGRLVVGILGHVAEHDWEQIRERLLRGRRRKAAERGVWPARLNRYGYRAVTRAEAEAIREYSGRDGEVYSHPEEAAVVRGVWEEFAAGESLAGIARSLNLRGIPAPQRGQWWPSAVSRLLRFEGYASGVLTYGSRTYRGYLVEGRKRYRIGEGEGVSIPCPVLIPAPLAAKVAARLVSEGASPQANAAAPWPLRGCVFCGTCRRADGGAPACVAHRKTRNAHSRSYHYRYYQCQYQEKRGGVFCGSLFRADQLEDLVREVLWEATAPGCLSALLAARHAPPADLSGELREVGAALAGLDIEEERIADLILSGVRDALVKAKVAGIHARRQALEERRAALLSRSEAAGARARVVATAEETAREVRFRLVEPGASLAGLARVTLRKGEAPALLLFPDL